MRRRTVAMSTRRHLFCYGRSAVFSRLRTAALSVLSGIPNLKFPISFLNPANHSSWSMRGLPSRYFPGPEAKFLPPPHQVLFTTNDPMREWRYLVLAFSPAIDQTRAPSNCLSF